LFTIAKYISSLILLRDLRDNRNLVPAAIIKDSENHIEILQRFFAIGTAYVDLFYLFLSNYIKKEVDKFNPEVIYTIMGNIRLIRFTNCLANRYNIPVIPHFMDDWISTTYTGSSWYIMPRKYLKHYLNKLLKNTKTGLCISNKMCNEYKQRYNINFIPLMNAINSKNCNPLRFNNICNQDEIVYAYFGGLHLNRWKTLLELSKVIDSIKKDINKPIYIKVYTSEDNIKKYSDKLAYNNIILNKSVEHKEVMQIMINSDFLVHIESFEPSVIQFTKLSISTKIPEYLASGIPIIAIGPSNIASIEYLINNNCAYVATSIVHSELKKIISDTIEGKSNLLHNLNKKALVDYNIKSVKSFHHLVNNISC
jgi:hypothetical protein